MILTFIAEHWLQNNGPRILHGN